MSKTIVRKYINDAVKKISKEDVNFDIKIPVKEFGDYATNVGLILCRKLHKNHSELNKLIITNLTKAKGFNSCFSDVKELNGFINFTLNPTYFQKEIKAVLKNKDKYFDSKNIAKTKKTAQVEFVSANPTGPLTLANARGAFYGNALVNILKHSGFNVKKEYYVNNVGNQIHNLGIAIMQAWNINPKDYGYTFDKDNVYKGGYVSTLADIVRPKIKGDLKKYLKTHNPEQIGSLGAKENLAQIKYVLSKTNITFDKWFLESDLKKLGFISKAFNWLVKAGFTYKKEGAVWLKTTEMFKDDKDRVLERSEGTLETYFLSDIAYHLEKFSNRKFDLVIDIFGADHFTHAQKILWIIDKMKETKLIKPNSHLDIILMQFMTILKNGKPFKMSKRKGNFVLFEDFVSAVGSDAASFFILDRSTDTHLDFDFDLAVEQSDKNPVYYIQYAYARICSILKKAGKVDLTKINLSLLKNPHEIALAKEILKLPDLIQDIAKSYEVHLLTKYVVDLARIFHSFYQACPIIKSDKETKKARLALLTSAKITLELCFKIMNIQAKKKM